MSPRPGPSPDPAADGPVWAVGSVVTAFAAVTGRLAEQTGRALHTRADVLALVGRYSTATSEQLAGRMFEIVHASSFDRDAIARGSGLRAEVTEWVVGGSQNGPVDLRIVDGDTVVAQVQAKLVANPVTAARDLARPCYAGTQRLVASDRYADVDRVLGKALDRDPAQIDRAGYLDARRHLGDAVHADGVRSTPVTASQMRAIAGHPVRWANGRVVAAAARQAGAAAATGAAAGAVVGAAVEACRQVGRVRAGEVTSADAASAVARASATAAAVGGAVAGLGELVRIAATARVLPAAVGAGAAPMAVAGGVVGVVRVCAAWAGGDLDATGLATGCAGSVLDAGSSWAGAVLGQAVIPVPIVGSAVGAMTIRWVGGLVVEAVHRWVAATPDDAVRPGPAAQIEAVPTGEDLRDRSVACLAVVLAGVGALSATRTACEEEFDAWMTDPSATLVLDPGGARS